MEGWQRYKRIDGATKIGTRVVVRWARARRPRAHSRQSRALQGPLSSAAFSRDDALPGHSRSYRAPVAIACACASSLRRIDAFEKEVRWGRQTHGSAFSESQATREQPAHEVRRANLASGQCLFKRNETVWRVTGNTRMAPCPQETH